MTAVARRHGINKSTLNNWMRNSQHKAWKETSPASKKMSTYVPSPQEFKELENENSQLNKLLDEKDLEVAILKDLLKKRGPGFPRR
ncbi:transposase [Heliorestis convoluta]|nr:transposase [Heliorestis convoluta]